MQASKDEQAQEAPAQDSELGSDNDRGISSEDDSDLEPSSASFSSSEDVKGMGRAPKIKKKVRGKRGDFAYETPENCVAVLVVGCWTMRIPVFLNDFVG
jgi:RNA polymerase I-specific transcription initiation factor RRN7